MLPTCCRMAMRPTRSPPSATARHIRSVHRCRAPATRYFSIRPSARSSLERSYRAATQAQQLLGAPRYAAGSYPLVMDYAMAKGLAHEAFGHAAETDGMRTSILGTNGVFRSGERMAAPIVSIIDEPLERRPRLSTLFAQRRARGRATILDHGVLTDALADVFSARAAGARVIDAARAQSYGNVPVPRMTNIRIELPDPVPIDGDYEDQGPEDVRAALLNAGYITAGQPVIYLAGYKGGQVNPATGRFRVQLHGAVRTERRRHAHVPARYLFRLFARRAPCDPGRIRSAATRRDGLLRQGRSIGAIVGRLTLLPLSWSRPPGHDRRQELSRSRIRLRHALHRPDTGTLRGHSRYR